MRAHNFIDLSGKRFGRLTVVKLHLIRISGKDLKKKPQWSVVCDCGVQKVVDGASLRNGDTSSCGCFMREKIKQIGFKNKIHGMRNSRLYSIWRSMNKRCYDTKHLGYKNYGARGINICSRWRIFKNFMDDMLESYNYHVTIFGEDNTKIDRKDFDGNYELTNCRWVTRSENSKNRRPRITLK